MAIPPISIGRIQLRLTTVTVIGIAIVIAVLIYALVKL